MSEEKVVKAVYKVKDQNLFSTPYSDEESQTRKISLSRLEGLSNEQVEKLAKGATPGGYRFVRLESVGED
jgi:hypothetical protein